MTTKYLIREDGLICEWHKGIRDFTGLKPYEFPIETKTPVATKKSKKEIPDGDTDDSSS